MRLLADEPRLVVLEPDDFETLRTYCLENAEHLAPWEPLRERSWFSAANMRTVVADRYRQYLDGTAVHLCALDAGGRMVAECNFTNIVRGPFQACTLGFSVAQASEGKGIMTTVLKQGIDIIFGGYRLHRIMANYMPRNAASARVLEKCGFVREGFARCYLKIGGCWEDHVLTALINSASTDGP